MFYQTTDHGAVQRKKGFSGFLNWNNLDSSRPRKGSGTPGHDGAGGLICLMSERLICRSDHCPVCSGALFINSRCLSFWNLHRLRWGLVRDRLNEKSQHHRRWHFEQQFWDRQILHLHFENSFHAGAKPATFFLDWRLKACGNVANDVLNCGVTTRSSPLHKLFQFFVCREKTAFHNSRTCPVCSKALF